MNPLRIIDLGAGNGWLAYRLALRGHHVAAIDLRIDSFDGLGAHVHYDSAFLPVRANYERLPFAGDQFDLAIFSASLHYAVKCETALCEALRVLRPGGTLVVMDSPLYANDDAGRAMIRRRETAYRREHGFAAETLEAEGFLTRERLRELARAAEINWTRFHPYLGAERVIRSAVARVTGRHRPADFPVLIAKKEFTREFLVVELEHTL